MKKFKGVLLLSHPHAGSSILKSILGHCSNAVEIIDESIIRQPQSEEKGMVVVQKWPNYCYQTNTRPFADYLKVILIRDPRHAFKSLRERFPDGYPEDHREPCSLANWNWIASQYVHSYAFYSPDHIAVRYEDLFADDCSLVKTIMDRAGLQWDDSVFENTNRQNEIYSGDASLLPELSRLHILNRRSQINTKFCNKNKDLSTIPTDLRKEVEDATNCKSFGY